mmetsp:Transcript_113099/g.320063  ORF Transcript_113099/g.320063 Transcript_113099/m.320063 type:complete len:241 (-) Transcript_113099:101-823(-)
MRMPSLKIDRPATSRLFWMLSFVCEGLSATCHAARICLPHEPLLDEGHGRWRLGRFSPQQVVKSSWYRSAVSTPSSAMAAAIQRSISSLVQTTPHVAHKLCASLSNSALISPARAVSRSAQVTSPSNAHAADGRIITLAIAMNSSLVSAPVGPVSARAARRATRQEVLTAFCKGRLPLRRMSMRKARSHERKVNPRRRFGHNVSPPQSLLNASKIQSLCIEFNSEVCLADRIATFATSCI